MPLGPVTHGIRVLFFLIASIALGINTHLYRGQRVTVHCTGYGKNRNLSEKFWSTRDPGQVWPNEVLDQADCSILCKNDLQRSHLDSTELQLRLR